MVLSGIKQDRTKGQTNYIQLAVAVSQKIWTAGEKLATYVEMQGKIKSEDSELHKERSASIKGLQVCKSDKIPSLFVTYTESQLHE